MYQPDKTWRVWPLTVVLGSLALASWLVLDSSAPQDVSLTASVATVLALAVLAEIRSYSVSFGNSRQLFIPYEVPWVIGMAVMAPRTLIVTQLAASFVSSLILRRTPIRAAFNVTLNPLAAAVTLELAMLVGGTPNGSLRSWIGIAVGVVVAQLVTNLCISIAIRLSGESIDTNQLFRSLLVADLISLTLATLTWTLTAIAFDTPAVLLPTALLLAGFLPLVGRAMRIVRKANSYERLLKFTRAVVAPEDESDQLASIMTMMRSHISAQLIVAYFREHRTDDDVRVLRVDASGFSEERVSLGEAGAIWAKHHDEPVGVVTLDGAECDLFTDAIGAAKRIEIVNSTNAESTVVWVAVDPAADSDAKRDDPNQMQFAAMAEQVFTWLALQRHIRDSEHLATHDALTGLPNRDVFREALQEAIDGAKVEGGQCGLLLLDVDGFKLVNDSWGHATGDRLLVHIAQIVKPVLPHGAVLARLSGDEFAAAIPGVDEQRLLSIAEAVRLAVATPFMPLDGVAIETLSSIGLAIGPDDADTADRLLHLADSAMYSVKASGSPERVLRYEEGRDGHTERKARIKLDIEHALASNGIEVVFQPIYSLTDHRLIKFEALARMSPNGKFLSPSEFIPVAEATGQIHQLTARVLDLACARLRSWNDTDVAMSVNLSVHNLVDRNFAQSLARVLARHGLAGERLVCEVTESMLMKDTATAIKTLEQLREMGITVSIDDFGTGHSSMQYLATLPVDEVKIDRSFVVRAMDHANASGAQRDTNLLEAVIELCRKLGFTVTVEGLEDSDAVAMVTAMGAHLGQGYVFSRPMSVAQADELVESYRHLLRNVGSTGIDPDWPLQGALDNHSERTTVG
jgi:diguanylate cyclase (GGDEF)-like protein